MSNVTRLDRKLKENDRNPPNTGKSDKPDSWTPHSPLDNRKSKLVEKHREHNSPSSSFKKPERSSSSWDTREKMEKKEKSGREVALENTDRGKSEKQNQEGAGVVLRKKRLDARTYRTSFKPQAKKIKQSDLSEARRRVVDISPEDSDNPGTSGSEEVEEGADECNGKKGDEQREKYLGKGAEKTVKRSNYASRKVSDGALGGDDSEGFNRKGKFCMGEAHESKNRDTSLLPKFSDNVIPKTLDDVGKSEVDCLGRQDVQKNINDTGKTEVGLSRRENLLAPELKMSTSSEGKARSFDTDLEITGNVGNLKRKRGLESDVSVSASEELCTLETLSADAISSSPSISKSHKFTNGRVTYFKLRRTGAIWNPICQVQSSEPRNGVARTLKSSSSNERDLEEGEIRESSQSLNFSEKQVSVEQEQAPGGEAANAGEDGGDGHVVPLCHVGENVSQNIEVFNKCIRRIEKVLDRRRRKIRSKQLEEIEKFMNFWEREKEKLKKARRLELDLIVTIHDNALVRSDKLKKTDEYFERKMDELETRMETIRREIVSKQQDAKNQEKRIRAGWLDAAENGRLSELFAGIPLTDSGFKLESMVTSEWNSVRNISENLKLRFGPSSEPEKADATIPEAPELTVQGGMSTEAPEIVPNEIPEDIFKEATIPEPAELTVQGGVSTKAPEIVPNEMPEGIFNEATIPEPAELIVQGGMSTEAPEIVTNEVPEGIFKESTVPEPAELIVQGGMSTEAPEIVPNEMPEGIFNEATIPEPAELIVQGGMSTEAPEIVTNEVLEGIFKEATIPEPAKLTVQGGMSTEAPETVPNEVPEGNFKETISPAVHSIIMNAVSCEDDGIDNVALERKADVPVDRQSRANNTNGSCSMSAQHHSQIDLPSSGHPCISSNHGNTISSHQPSEENQLPMSPGEGSEHMQSCGGMQDCPPEIEASMLQPIDAASLQVEQSNDDPVSRLIVQLQLRPSTDELTVEHNQLDTSAAVRSEPEPDLQLQVPSSTSTDVPSVACDRQVTSPSTRGKPESDRQLRLTSSTDVPFVECNPPITSVAGGVELETVVRLQLPSSMDVQSVGPNQPDTSTVIGSETEARMQFHLLPSIDILSAECDQLYTFAATRSSSELEPRSEVHRSSHQTIGTQQTIDAIPHVEQYNNLLSESNVQLSMSVSTDMPLGGIPMGDGGRIRMLPESINPTPPMTTRQSQVPYLDPLKKELAKLRMQEEQVIKMHEDVKSRLESECEKEIEKVRQKYNGLIKDVEIAFMETKKMLEVYSSKVHLNMILAQAFQIKCSDAQPGGPPSRPGPSSTIMQQFPSQSLAQTVQSPLRPPAPPVQVVHHSSALFSSNPPVPHTSSVIPVVIPHVNHSSALFSSNPPVAHSSPVIPAVIPHVNHSSALFSSNPPVPHSSPVIPALIPRVNLQFGSAPRATPPHLQPFRPSMSATGQSLPLSGIRNQMSLNTSFPSRVFNRTQLPVNSCVMPAVHSPLSALELPMDVGSLSGTNLLQPLSESDLEALYPSGQTPTGSSRSNTGTDSLHPATVMDVVCLSDDD